MRLGLEPGDHLVDLTPGDPHLRFQLLGQLAAEGLLALLQRLFALAHPRFVGVQRLTRTRREPMLVFERPQIAIDLRQVLGQLRLARAQVLAGSGDD